MLCNRAKRSHDDQEMSKIDQAGLCVYRNYKTANTAEKVVDSLMYRKDLYVQFSLHNFRCKFLRGRFTLAEVNCQLAGK